MLPYLHILIRVESDGSLHALGAFSSKEKQKAYQDAIGLAENQVRLDFYNGPFEEGLKVVYAGHRRWNMDRFQLGGYFRTEGEAWNYVTQEGYVSVLRIDTSFEEEKELERQALERYAKLQKKWRLTSYEELVAREGIDKARANIMLRFYEDALESFKPKTRRDIRALYAFFVLVLVLPLAVYFFISQAPKYGENLDSVKWLPSYASDVSFYRSNQVDVYEFSVSRENFVEWAEGLGLVIRRISTTEILSRYKAYMPTPESRSGDPVSPDGAVTPDEFTAWQELISVEVTAGLVARSDQGGMALFDTRKKRAYFEELKGF